MTNHENQNIQNIDDEIKILKEKKQKLEEISSQIKNIHTQTNNVKQHENPNLNANKKTNKHSINTEKLVLTKQEILDFCDDVITKWENDPSKDTRHIFAMNAVKTSILWTEEDTIKDIWDEIIHWIFELLYKNAIAQGNSENLEWSKIMQKLNEHI